MKKEKKEKNKEKKKEKKEKKKAGEVQGMTKPWVGLGLGTRGEGRARNRGRMMGLVEERTSRRPRHAPPMALGGSFARSRV